MRLSDYVWIVRRNVVLLVVLTLLGVSVGLVASLVQSPRYQATTKVYISTQQATNLADLSSGATFAQQVVKSYADVVTTPLVLDPVVNSLHLSQSTDQLATQVSASTPIDTVLLDISVIDKSPAQAARIANAVAQSLSDAVSTLTPPTADSVSPVKVTVVQRAEAPTAPTIPNTRLNLLIGLVIGLVVGIFVALLRQALLQRAQEVGDGGATSAAPARGTGTEGLAPGAA